MSDAISKCNEIQPLLDAFHDGELSESERSAVEQHLLQCSQCQGALSGVELVASTLSSLPRLKPKRNFADSIDLIIAQSNSSDSPGTLSVNEDSAWLETDDADSQGDTVRVNQVNHLDQAGDTLPHVPVFAQAKAEAPPVVTAAPREGTSPSLKDGGPPNPAIPKRTYPAVVPDKVGEKRPPGKVVPFKRPFVASAVAAVALIALALNLTTTAPNTVNVATRPPSTQNAKAPEIADSEIDSSNSVPSVQSVQSVQTPQPVTAKHSKVSPTSLVSSPAVHKTESPTKPEVAMAGVKSEKINPHTAEDLAQLTPATTHGEPVYPEVVAVYDGEANPGEALGLSTDEDGLYALKL